MSKTTKIIDAPKTDKRVLIKINELLEKKKMYYSDVAKALNFKPEYGSPLMRGKRGLSVNHLIKIAEILEVSPASLLPEENPRLKLNFDEYIRQIVKDENMPILEAINRIEKKLKIKKEE